MTDAGEDLVETLEEILEGCEWGLANPWSQEKLQEMLRTIRGQARLAIDEALALCLVHSQGDESHG